MSLVRASRRAHHLAPLAIAGSAGLAAFLAPVPVDSQPAAAQAVVAPTTLAVGPVLEGARAAQLRQREQVRTSRSLAQSLARRPAPTPSLTTRPTPEVTGRRWTTVGVNVRTKPSQDSRVVATLDPATRLRVTDRAVDGYRMVLHDGTPRWVWAEFLVKQKPEATSAAAAAPGDLSMAPCATGSAVETGLVPNAVAVHRAVCARYPQITAYGGYRAEAGSYHATGQAVDIMVAGALGDEIAAWLQANAGALGITEIIWAQKIWTTQRAGEGWRWMGDRGSSTANHYDHVHVSVL
jgi:hypothetical protein